MTTKTKAIIAAAMGGIALLALLGGGAPTELEVKGLRLGMSVDEAARVMLGHGFEIGGRAAPGSTNWASREYKEAAVKHAAAHIRKVCAERGFPDIAAYVADRYPGGKPYHLGGPWDGKAELKLEQGLFSNQVLQGDGWGLAVDGERRVAAIELTGRAVEKLFGAGDMSAEEFAASFARAYGVPLEPTAEVVDPDIALLTGNFLKSGWAFVNREDGWAINISDAKVLEIRAITPTSQHAFD